MKSKTRAFRAEVRKAAGSPVSWGMFGAGLLFPLISTLFMTLVKDPEGARRMGLLGAKARLSGLEANWPAFLNLLLQAEAVGFLFLSALYTTWLFGREWSDGTLKLLLAVPAGRVRVVAGKLGVLVLWGAATLVLMAAAVAFGALVGLPGWDAAVFGSWLAGHALVGGLTLALAPWVAFFASWGRGFLVPVVWTLATVAAANLGAVLGWGGVVPWSIPSLYAGAGGTSAPEGAWIIVVVTGLAGAVATGAFWARADHPR